MIQAPVTNSIGLFGCNLGQYQHKIHDILTGAVPNFVINYDEKVVLNRICIITFYGHAKLLTGIS
jgi:hypothetical protein